MATGDLNLTGIDPMHHAGVVQLAAQMQRSGNDSKTPVRATLIALGDRWSTLIIVVLRTGTWRYAELQRILSRLAFEERISRRVLTQKLRSLERDGFVFRYSSGRAPPKVSYGLTPLGQGLGQEISQLIEWIDSRSDEILAARSAFDMARSDT